MLDVYTWEPNANSGKPLLMLKEKGADFRYHYIDMGKREQHTAQYLALNPDGTVPTVVHDGLVLTESSPTLEYLDAALGGPPLSPRDPVQLWRMRWWMRFVDLNLCPALAMFGGAGASAQMPEQDPQEVEQQVRTIPMPERRRVWRLILMHQVPEAELAESQRRIDAGIRRLECALGEHPWLAGADYSLADIVALATVHSMPSFRPEAVNDHKTPRFMDWLRRAHARPGIQAAFALGRGWVKERAEATRKLLGIAG
jgi:GST-like protein